MAARTLLKLPHSATRQLRHPVTRWQSCNHRPHCFLTQVAVLRGCRKSSQSYLATLVQSRSVSAVSVDLERPVIDFNSAEVAFNSKTTFELMRSWMIFKICSFRVVVRHCDSLYAVSLKVLGANLTHSIMRHLMFNHFCAGETVEGIIPRMQQLRDYGIGGILDYAAEAKDEPPVAAEACEETTVGAPVSARTFDYKGESMCDANVEIFLKAIHGVRDTTPNGFAAIKLTGLGNPMLLERMSTCLVEMTELFRRLTTEGQMDKVRQPYYCMDRSFLLDWDTFQKGWRSMFHVRDEEELRQFFAKLDTSGDGVISFLEWSESINLSEINELCRSCTEEGPLFQAALDDAELDLYWNMISRVKKILDEAQQLGVRVMIDAEWMDIQPAIDHLVIHLQRIYNRQGQPLVFQTYQTYLKGMHSSVLHDLERSKREGWCFGAKVVRGAYMVSEREKASNRGLLSPVCDTYEATEENFHRVINAILEHNSPKGSEQTQNELLVASHNRGSVEYTLQRIQELGNDHSKVHFGQLLGMADHLTFTLGTHGYKAYKYVPYGPIDEVVPYLIRRTQENSTLLGAPGVQEERKMVTRELRRRLLRF